MQREHGGDGNCIERPILPLPRRIPGFEDDTLRAAGGHPPPFGETPGHRPEANSHGGYLDGCTAKREPTREATMVSDECRPVSVSRRIEAPASVIFRLLADPDRHPEFDGSDMLRTGASNEVIAGVGSVFTTKMYFTAMGDYEMHNRIVAFEANRCIAWEPGNPELARNGSCWRFDLSPDGPNATVVTETYDCRNASESVRKAVDNGHAWLAGMTRTLERLDQVCTRSS